MKPDRRGPKRRGEDGSRHSGVAPLGAALQAYLRASGIGPRIHESKIHRAWIEAIGPDLARHARPVRFQHGELLVQVDSSAHLGELRSFTGEHYRNQANRILQGERIERVVFKLVR